MAKPDFLVRKIIAVTVYVTLFSIFVIMSESVAIWRYTYIHILYAYDMLI